MPALDTARPRGGDEDARPEGRRTLSEVSIRLKSTRPGEHRAACPECARGKARNDDDALAVRVEPDGRALWGCHRCGWSGSTRSPADRQEGFRPRPALVAPPKPPGDLNAALRLWRATRPITAGTIAAKYLE